MMSGDGYR